MIRFHPKCSENIFPFYRSQGAILELRGVIKLRCIICWPWSCRSMISLNLPSQITIQDSLQNYVF